MKSKHYLGYSLVLLALLFFKLERAIAQPFISNTEHTKTLYVNYPTTIQAAYLGKEKNYRLVGKNIEVQKIVPTDDEKMKGSYTNTYCILSNGQSPAVLAFVNAKGDTLEKTEFHLVEIPQMIALTHKGSDKVIANFEEGQPMNGNGEVLSWRIGFDGSSVIFTGQGDKLTKEAMDYIRECPPNTKMFVEADYIATYSNGWAYLKVTSPKQKTKLSQRIL